jgi:hypothetical protein
MADSSVIHMAVLCWFVFKRLEQQIPLEKAKHYSIPGLVYLYGCMQEQWAIVLKYLSAPLRQVEYVLLQALQGSLAA